MAVLQLERGNEAEALRWLNTALTMDPTIGVQIVNGKNRRQRIIRFFSGPFIQIPCN